MKITCAMRAEWLMRPDSYVGFDFGDFYKPVSSIRWHAALKNDKSFYAPTKEGAIDKAIRHLKRTP